MRHLTESQTLAALDRGRPVEQLLPQSEPDVSVIEWLRLSPRSAGVALVRHRVRDAGTPGFLDVYEFPAVDPDEEHGEGKVLEVFPGCAEALEASRKYGAQADRWVTDGMVQDEYADLTRH